MPIEGAVAIHALTQQHILIVDEYPEKLTLLGDILGRIGCQITQLPAKKAALAIGEECLPDLIVLDIQMSNSWGFDLIGKLKSEGLTKSIPVIFISTLLEIQEKENAFTAGCYDYITKPFSAEEVLIRVKNCLLTQHYHWQIENTLLERTTELTHEKGKLALESEKRQKYERVESQQLKLLLLRSDIGRALVRGKIVREMLQECCKFIVLHLDIALSRVWLLNESHDFLELQASAGMYTRIDGKHSKKLFSPNNIIGNIAFSKSAYFTNSIIDDPVIDDQEWLKREKIVSFAGHPLLIEGKVLGVIGLFSQKHISHVFSTSLASVANQISIGIQRKLAESSLATSETKFRELIEDAVDWIWEINQQGIYTYSSPRIRDLLGYEPEDIVGKTPFDFMTISEAKRVGGLFQEIVAGRKNINRLENSSIHKNGTPVVFETSGRPIFDAQGEFCGYRGIDRNITERKEAVDALRQSEKKLREAQEIAQIGYWELNFRTNELFLSAGLAKTLGLGKDEFAASYQAFLDIVHPEDRDYFDRAYTDSLKDKTKFDIVHRIICKDGTVKHLHERCLTEYDANGISLRSIGTTQDVSDLKEAEFLKDRVEGQLRHAQKIEAIGTLAGGIAHDFNNILAAIVGYADLAKDDLGNSDLLTIDIQEIRNAADRATNLVRQILTFSRKSDKQEKAALQVSLIVKEALKMLRSSIPSTIAIKQEITSNGLVLADPTQIHQIVMNLCTYAYHAMRETGGILAVTLKEIDLSDANNLPNVILPAGMCLELAVSDSGIGMDPETKEKIFEPYFTTKNLGEGTGLGLAVVHGIVSSYGGSIQVESEPGEGTTFRIYFPLYEGKRGNYPHAKQEILLVGGNETIMLVDDEQAILNMSRQFFERQGYHVDVFTNGVQALQEFQHQPDKYDLVITDMTMPYMTGTQLAQKILETRADTPIILCTGHSELTNRQQSLDIGIRQFLEKPLTMNSLLRTVRKVLDATKINGARILFVDDVKFNLNLGEVVLRRLGCDVVGVMSGEEALALFAKDPNEFDVIFTDQNMPNMTGLELAKQVKDLRSDMPIFLITGDEVVLDERLVQSSGIRGMLGKSLEENALISAIASVLR